MTGRWASSNRRSRLPADWPQRVAATRDRARGRCEAEQHVDDCDGIGTQCDHHQHGDDHSLANLRWLSTPCHKAKTQAEAAAAHRAHYDQAKRRPQRHPSELI